MRFLMIVAAVIAAISGSTHIACSQHYYVVIGAFAADENASEFKGYLPGQSIDTSYTIADKNNQLHYYVLKLSDNDTAVAQSLHLQKAMQSLTSVGRSAIVAEGGAANALVTVDPSAGPLAVNTASASGSSAVANASGVPPKPAGKYFKFRIESPEGNAMTAQVHQVDLKDGREVAAYKGNTFVDLLQPGHREPMALMCGIFGYKEVLKYVDYNDPSRTDREAYVDADGAWVIPYELERLEKGDVSLMYNVSFYKDAAIMRSESQIDLDELVKMMHSNPYYEIVVHSHCNGKGKREIIAAGSDRNYFDAAGSVTVMGSAKDLTTLRAEAIRDYLIDHGVDGQRIETFSWGASDMLVKADSPDAEINNRIEIEITRD